MSVQKVDKDDWLVPYNYLPQQFSNRLDIFDEWNELTKTAEYTLGSRVEEFENSFARFIGAKYCISTNTGTEALILALRAVGVNHGDEVITVPNSFYATTGAIVACGATPVFVDVDSRYQMNVDALESVITRKTKAVLPVHWAGASPDLRKITEISNSHHLAVIEDACMAIGGTYHGVPKGNTGTIGAFSMHPLKSLNVMGDGGMLVTNDEAIYSWALAYRNHGMKDRDHIKIWGVNARLQPLQAIVASLELPKINDIINVRNRNAKIVDESLTALHPWVTTPERYSYDLETYSLYMVLCEDRDKLLTHLRDKKIDVKIHYPIPLHLQDAAKSLGYRVGSFPESESQAKKLLTLPIHQYLSDKQLNYMIEAIINFYSKN